MSVFFTEWRYVTHKVVFSPSALSRSQKPAGGSSKFCQVYFHCSTCTRCHRAVTAFAEASCLRYVPLSQSFPIFFVERCHSPRLLEGRTSSHTAAFLHCFNHCHFELLLCLKRSRPPFSPNIRRHVMTCSL